MSNLHTKPALALLFLESITLLAIRVAFKICLPSAKALWNSYTTFLKIFFILLAKIFPPIYK